MVRYAVVAAAETWTGLGFPKKVGVSDLRDLRPIRSMGCIYKIISKLDWWEAEESNRHVGRKSADSVYKT